MIPLFNFYLYFLAFKSTWHGRLEEVASSPHSPGPVGSKSERAGRGPRRYALHSAKIQLFRQNSLRQHANPRGQVPPGSRDTCMMMYIYVYMFFHLYIYISLYTY